MMNIAEMFSNISFSFNMEVAVISVESIKPYSLVCDLKPFNLCLLDQLTPTTYNPLILFYNTKDTHLNSSQITSQLKWSLSKTLNSFYPLSGRVKDNLFIHKFDEGVPFSEARVKGQLFDFLRSARLEMLNQFLPCQPFCHQLDPTAAQLAVQVNVFDCGGIALGVCSSHKINDGTTNLNFGMAWAANARGSYDKVIEPNLLEAALMFPPHKSLPSRYTSLMELFWFSKRKCRTRLFVFDENAVATLRTAGRSELVADPTRVEALTAFIWRSAMKALKTVSAGSPRVSFMSQSVNIRRLTQPRMSRYSIGNLVMPAYAGCNPDETEMEMKQWVSLVKEGIGKIDDEYVKRMSGDGGSAAFLKNIDKLEEILVKENAVEFSFSSWHRFGSSEIDFGWGKPLGVGIFGETSRKSASDSNFIVLKEMGRNKGIEAWMTLDERIMDMVEHDPEFLAFANPCANVVTFD